MVTTARRRISTEQDRFGGYGIQPSGKAVADETAKENTSTETERFSYRTVMDEPSYSVPYTETAQKSATDSVIEYTSRPYYGAYDYSVPIQAPTRSKKARKREREDVMPSIRTRAYAEQKPEQEVVKREKTRLSGKAKVALIAYVAIVTVLAVMVVVIGLTVSNINARSASLESEIALKSSQLADIRADISELTDFDTIASAAEKNGMEKIDSVIEVELVPTVTPTEYEGRTNWFDKVCDFISKVIGG